MVRDAKIYYNIIKDIYDFSWENKKLLDEKGSKNIVSVGILLTLYSAMVSIILTSSLKYISPEQFIEGNYVLVIIFIIELVILLTSFLSAGYAYSKLDKWEVIPFRPNVFIEKYATHIPQVGLRD